MFVKLSNGMYVEDPLFYGKEWFLDCREEPTLVVHIYRDPKEQNLRARIRKILRDAGIKATLLKEESHRATSPFPPNFNGLKKSASIRLTLLDVIPAGTLVSAEVYVTERPKGQEVLNECLESDGLVGA